MIVSKDITNIFYYYKPQLLTSIQLFCIVVLVLLMYGISSYMDEGYHVSHELDWAYGTYTLDGSSNTISLGLSVVVFTQTDSNGIVTTVEQRLSDCPFVVCQTCDIAGWLTKDFIVASLFCLAVVALLSILRKFNRLDNKHLKRLTVVFSLATWIIIAIAYGHWNEECYQQFDNSTFIVYDISQAGGFILTVVAWIFTTIILIFHLLIPSNDDRLIDEGVVLILKNHSEEDKSQISSSRSSTQLTHLTSV